MSELEDGETKVFLSLQTQLRQAMRDGDVHVSRESFIMLNDILLATENPKLRDRIKALLTDRGANTPNVVRPRFRNVSKL